MKNRIFYALALLIFAGCSQAENIDISAVPERGFFSESPAKYWNESLLSGNGTMGVMVMGDPYNDTIINNHAMLYMPINEPLLPVDQGANLDKIHQMMYNGDYGKASQFVVDLSHKEGYGNKRWTDPYVPAFDLVVNNTEKGTPTAYARTVDFQSGVIDVKWKDEKCAFSREVFVSRPDSVIVMRYRGDKEGAVNATINLSERISAPDWWGPGNKGVESVIIANEGNFITCQATFVNKWEGLIKGYDGVAKVINNGGKIENTPEGIKVEGADEVLVFVKIKHTWDENVRNTQELKDFVNAVKPDFHGLLAKHKLSHSAMFNRSKLDLGGDPEDRKLSSEKLLEKSRGVFNTALVERSYDAARYHTICAVGTNPPNLQGLWGGTMVPAWSADYTTNGNLPVAIGSMLSANMPELMLTTFNYLERHMPEFRVNAQRLFNCRGIHVPSRMSSHGYNNHFDAVWPMTFWTVGAAWYSMFYYDYYMHTGDEEFLRNRALPFMEESLLFYEDFLVKGSDGKYIFNPSYSPENNPANIPYQACINATMDVMAAKQLLRNTLAASRKLQVNEDKIQKWEDMLAAMPDYEIDKNGDLREWMWPGIEENHAHRHVSHLYGVYDIVDPEIADSPEFMAATKKVIEERMKIRRQDNGGVMAFGMAQMAYSAANLGESEQVYDMLTWFSSKYWTRNMFTTHDPGYLFNFDLTGGYPAIIIKMLVYSEPGLIKLLLAKSDKLPVGSIEGVLLRGSITLDKLTWDDNTVVAVMNSSVDQEIDLVAPKDCPSVNISGGEFGDNSSDTSRLIIKLVKNKPVTITFTCLKK